MSTVENAPSRAETGDSPTPDDGQAPPPPLRHNRDFLLLWAGAGFEMLSYRVAAIAYPMLVLWWHGSAGAAGLVGSMALLPHLVVQLPAGALVDRWNRRRLMILSQAGCVAVGAVVVAAVLLDRVWLPLLMVTAFAHGSFAVFYQLAERAGVPQLVSAGQVPAAITQNEARSRAAALLGQPVGTVLFSVLYWLPFAFGAVANLVSLGAIAGIRRQLQADRGQHRPRRLYTETAEGIVWMWRQRFLRSVMLYVAVSNILFQALVLAIMLIINQDGGSAGLIGVVVAGTGVGGMLGALSGRWWMRRISLRTIVVGGLVTWTVLIVPVAYVHQVALLCGLFAVSGYVGGVFNVAGGVYMVRIAPDSVRGRANSLAMLVGSGGLAIGPVAGGLLLELAGPTTTVLALAGVMGMLALASALSPAVRGVARTPEGAPLSRSTPAAEGAP